AARPTTEVARGALGCRPQTVELAACRQLGKRLSLELAHGVGGHPQAPSGLAQRRGLLEVYPVAELDDLAFALREPFERAAQRVPLQRDLHLLLGSAVLAGHQRPQGGLVLL